MYTSGYRVSKAVAYRIHQRYVIELRALKLSKGAEEDQDWKDDEGSRMGRLRQRRGRTVVHRSLEDNYGAVVVANHEALAQFLEQVRVSDLIYCCYQLA